MQAQKNLKKKTKGFLAEKSRSKAMGRIKKELTTPVGKLYMIKQKNSFNLLYLNRPGTKSSVILLNMRVGSNHENSSLRGISHFIEHLVFCGTKKRKKAIEISNEIEKLGGDLNAATSNEQTYYYVKILNKHFSVAADVLADMLSRPLFRLKDIEKERNVVIDEIKMTHDQPRHLQWILFEQELFKKHPARFPVYGNISSLKKITKKEIIAYYNKNYVMENLDVIVVGDLGEPGKLLKLLSSKIKLGKAIPKKPKPVKEPPSKKEKLKSFKKNTEQAYIVTGFKAVPRKHKASYALDIIKAHLARGQSGKLFDVIRNKHALAYDIGAYSLSSKSYGFFSIYLNTQKKNITKAMALVKKELNALKAITAKEIEEAKAFIEGSFLLQIEDIQECAELLAFWSTVSSAEDMFSYLSKISKLKKRDIVNAVKSYFSNPTTIIIN